MRVVLAFPHDIKSGCESHKTQNYARVKPGFPVPFSLFDVGLLKCKTKTEPKQFTSRYTIWMQQGTEVKSTKIKRKM